MQLLSLLNQEKESDCSDKNTSPPSSNYGESPAMFPQQSNPFTLETKNDHKFQGMPWFIVICLFSYSSLNSAPAPRQELLSHTDLSTLCNFIVYLRALRQNAIGNNDFRALNDISGTVWIFFFFLRIIFFFSFSHF
jgi:hypothetical protein